MEFERERERKKEEEEFVRLIFIPPLPFQQSIVLPNDLRSSLGLVCPVGLVSLTSLCFAYIYPGMLKISDREKTFVQLDPFVMNMELFAAFKQHRGKLYLEKLKGPHNLRQISYITEQERSFSFPFSSISHNELNELNRETDNEVMRWRRDDDKDSFLPRRAAYEMRSPQLIKILTAKTHSTRSLMCGYTKKGEDEDYRFSKVMNNVWR